MMIGTRARWTLGALVAVAVALPPPQPGAGAARSDVGRYREVGSEAETAGQPPSGWQPGFHLGEVEWDVNALAVYDDGTGPALYAAGWFFTAGGVLVNRVARWGGSSWSPLTGPAGTGVDDIVLALAVFDDGTGPALYASGYFHTAGGVEVNDGIARWDGVSWSSLPAGSSGAAAFTVFDDGTGPALYSGGGRSVARWDGASWSLVGAEFSGHVGALAVFDDGTGPALYAGGDFEFAGSVRVNRVARWNGASWSPLTGPSGTGVSRGVRALAAYNDGFGPGLYVGGLFGSAGGLTANCIARWDGTSWEPLEGPSGNGTDQSVRSLAVYDDGSGPGLVVGGDFRVAGGLEAKHIALWKGGAWSPLSGPAGNGTNGSGVYALAVLDAGSTPELYAGGRFTIAGGRAASNLARWDGMAWDGLGGGGLGVTGDVLVLTVWDDGTGSALYAGGDFPTAGDEVVYRIARYAGGTWASLSGPSGTGVEGNSSNVLSLQAFDDGSGTSLFVGGCFWSAGGLTANGIARWNASGWSTLAGPSATGVDGCVKALAVFDDGRGPALYAGGSFTSAGGVPATSVARWDGSLWSALEPPLGTDLEGSVSALAVYHDGRGPALYLGGHLTRVGGVIVHDLVRWDGPTWEPVGVLWAPYQADSVQALAVFDDGGGPALYAGGYFQTADGLTVNNVARWDGVEWSALSGPLEAGVSSQVEALRVVDLGSGPVLCAGGWFDVAGGVTTNKVACWDGHQWSDLHGPAGAGVYGFADVRVDALAAFDDGNGPALFAGGRFTVAAGVVSNRIAKWTAAEGFLFADDFESGGTARWSSTVP